jgi:DNA mismatch endonuclease (patch repair protein)
MASNRHRDTSPELALRSLLHGLGLRFRVDYAIRLDGRRPIRADVVFTRQRVAVFVDGCFWHSCPLHGSQPKTNADYWRPKLQGNRERDDLYTRLLEEAGWRVVRIWEHEPAPEAAARVVEALGTDRSQPRRDPG